MKKEIDYSGWISTYTGKKFYFLNTKPSMICIEDIAHSLSMICRFNGHTNRFYSVAQHSLLVEQLCPEELKLEGLMHDSTEGYFGDVTRPLKQLMLDYQYMENSLHKIINKKFKLKNDKKTKEIIKICDNIALITEKRDLKNNEPIWTYLNDIVPMKTKIKPWSPAKAEKEFLKRYWELSNNGTKSN